MGFWNGRIWELLDCRYNGKTTKCGGHRSWKVWAPAHNYCVSNPLTSSGLSFFLSKMGVIMWIHASASWGTEKVHLKTLKARVCVGEGGIVVQANLTHWGTLFWNWHFTIWGIWPTPPCYTHKWRETQRVPTMLSQTLSSDFLKHQGLLLFNH